MKEYAIRNIIECIFVIICICAILFGIGLIGYQKCEMDMRKQAIQHNAAEYTVNKLTGISKFQWKDELNVKTNIQSSN